MREITTGIPKHPLDNGSFKTTLALVGIIDIFIENHPRIFTQLKFGFILENHLNQTALLGLEDISFIDRFTLFEHPCLTIG